MPQQRLQLGSSVIEQPALRPAAQPVDTYSTAGASAGNELSQLASGLSQLVPSLARFTDAYGEKYASDQKEAGTAAARKASEANQSFKDAIAAGVIPRGASPFYVAGFREQYGRVTADKWQSDLVQDMARDPKLKDSTNVADFDAFVAQHKKDWLDKNVGTDNRDPAFERGFGFRSDAYVADSRYRFANDVAKRVEGFSEDAHWAEVNKHVEDSYQTSTPEAIGEDINKLHTDLIAQGRDPGQLNRIAVSAVQAAALSAAQKGDPRAQSILDILQHINGGSGTLDHTQYGKAAIIETTAQISRVLHEKDVQSAQDAATKREADTDGVFSAAVKALSDNPGADISSFIKQLGTINPRAVTALTELKQSVQTSTFASDPAVVNQRLSDIWTDPGSVSAYSLGVDVSKRLLSPHDAAFLNEQVESAKTAAANGVTFSDPLFTSTSSSMHEQFAPTGAFDKKETAAAYATAQATLHRDWADFIQGAGAKATTTEKVQWLQNESNSLVQHYMNGGRPNPDIVKPVDSVDPLKSPVMSHSDAVRVMAELYNGAFSRETVQLFNQYHMGNTVQIRAFVNAQAQLLGVSQQEVNKARTPEPVAPTPAPVAAPKPATPVAPAEKPASPPVTPQATPQAAPVEAAPVVEQHDLSLMMAADKRENVVPGAMSDTLPTHVLSSTVDDVLKKYPRVPKSVVWGIIQQESTGVVSATATNKKDLALGGSRGLMQMSLQTARALGYTGEPGDPKKLTGIYDPRTNIELGVKYLNDLLVATKGDVQAAISAYNGGLSPERPGDAKRKGHLHSDPVINEEYVRNVLEYGKSAPPPATEQHTRAQSQKQSG